MPEAKDVRPHLIEALERDLVGPYSDDELLRLPPSRWYLTGFLVPRQAREAPEATAIEAEIAGSSGADAESNSYFAQVVSGLSIPDPGRELENVVRLHWGDLKNASAELLPAAKLLHDDLRAALQPYDDTEVLRVVAALREDRPPPREALRTAELKQLLAQPFEIPGELPNSDWSVSEGVIYCAPAGDPTPMAAVLISTGTPGSEGTLGGLIEQGRRLRAHLRRAYDLGVLCSNDPVCGTHSPSGDPGERHLEGAACHGCLFVAECSCERFNRYLDRVLVIPTIGQDRETAFLRDRP